MKLFILGLVVLLLIGGLYVYDEYSIPQLIPEDYDCEEHPGFISNSNYAPFESQQHYINRKNKAVENQIKEVCD